MIRIDGTTSAPSAVGFRAMTPQHHGRTPCSIGLLDRSRLYGVVAEIERSAWT